MIVVTTPTGAIGRRVVENLLASGEAIRVIVRDPARLSPQVRERVEVVRGSMADLDVVNQALEGAGSVLWIVPPDPQATSLPGHVMKFAGPLCEAIGRQGVERVVAVSSLGRGLARNAGQISAIFALDHLIECTGVNYRSLQPAGFMENLLRQPIRSSSTFFSLLPGDLEQPLCATRDIAAVATELLLDDTWHGQRDVPIRGPEDLSQTDLARIMSEVLERPIRYQRVAGEAYKEALVRNGSSEAWAQGMVDMESAIERGIYAV